MATASARGAKFGAGRLLVSDSRLTLGALNYARHRALYRVFGVSRAEANLLTFVLALGAVDPAARVARRVVRAPRVLTGAGSAMSGFTVREGALGIAGPGVREGPLVATLLAAAMIGGLAVPRLRRAASRMRAAEHRLRVERERRYSDARRAFGV